MKSDQEFLNQVEAYLRGDLNDSDNLRFEDLLSKDQARRDQFNEHRAFMEGLHTYGGRINLQHKLDDIHANLDIESIIENALPRKTLVVRLWDKYKINSLVAASVAILAVFSTLWLTGFYAKDDASQYIALRRDMNNIRQNVKAQNALIKDINRNQGGIATPSHYGATGFALSSNGYIMTTYHVIKGADSVYIQNNTGDSYKVKVVFTDPAYDIAVLQIIDEEFKDLGHLPYTFKQHTTDIGEDVYTIGFPREEAVYGRGYLSSNTGYSGDTVAYQVSIPVNPGNSGGPVLDNRGNIIGVINSKQTETDGAAFAIKADYVLKAIESIPEDSLEKKIQINKKNSLSNLSRTEQIKKVQDYIYMVKVY
ncbi:trypsin-like peptidase domain-containing protein [Olivibacter sp. SDN3]|uniref:S1C family serine protease n=1 Tax=Olivibacter sp. SDN3 TaxID=2764720 RepID=UPI0016515E98|nr:serine protease [Olivibacter sp. SDN3]QNL48855.1 trypsin-like peptidase domain-containing protein [Olivibacter sp. SDN3]